MRKAIYLTFTLTTLLYFALGSKAYGALNKSVENQYLPVKNLLTNPGVENGRTRWGASTASHLTVTTTAAQVASGSRALAYDAAADNDKMFSDTIAVPNALKGRNCLGKILYINGDANVQFQVTDGTNILASNTLATVSTHTASYVSFICPSSGNIRLEVEATADAAATHIDDAYLGENYLVSQVSQAQLVGSGYYPFTTDCQWELTSASYDVFPADADCPAMTVESGGVSTPSTKIPGITVNDLPPGKYHVTSYFNTSTGAQSILSAQLWDGTTASGDIAYTNDGTQSDLMVVAGVFEYSASGDRTFQLRGGATASQTFRIANQVQGRELRFVIQKYPTVSETVFTPETVGWFVDATISGANIDLGTSDQATYTGIEDGSLTLTNNNTGNLTAQIPCSSTNASSGTTCSVGNESVGIAFDLPKAGAVWVCASFSHFLNLGASSDVSATFQIVETPNNAQTVTTEGITRSNSAIFTGASDTDTAVIPHTNCARFAFTSAGQKTLRLFYEQDVTVGTINQNRIIGDASATIGQRDIHWTVYPISEHVPQPLILNHVSSLENSGVKLFASNINCDAGSSFSGGDGAIASVGNISSGACLVTFVSNSLPGTPLCGLMSQTAGVFIRQGATSTSTMSIDCKQQDGSTNCTAWDAGLICVSEK